MTKERYKIVFLNGFNKLCSIQDTFARIPTFYNDLGYVGSVKPVCDLLNEKEEMIQKQNQEITACYDTLTTIHELCDAVLNYDFKNVKNVLKQ